MSEQIRERIHREDEDWENLYAASGGADGVTILSEVPALGIRAGKLWDLLLGGWGITTR
ncbi:hypothetical protein ACETU7_35225 [Rhodococcus sp. 3Y1]